MPDVAFPANVSEHAYLICDGFAPCTSGTPGFTLGSTGRDGGGVGGTSASAPNFAAMLAVIEQANGGKALGNINPSLYALAAGNAGSSIFHDITSGSNIVPCTVGTADCTTGSLGYTATTGYDLVTGLGSIAAPALSTGLQSLAQASPTGTPTVAVTASVISPAIINSAITFTAAVAGNSGTPTGSVTFALDGGAAGSAITLSSGTASLTLASGFSTTGTHTVKVTYSGDSNYLAASNTLTLTLASSTGSFSLNSSPATLTITAGSTGTEKIAIVSNGFTGALTFSAALTSATSSSFPYCLSITPVSLIPTSAVTAVLTINTASSCAAKSGNLSIAGGNASLSPKPTMNRRRPAELAVLFGGVAIVFGLRRRRSQASLLLLGAAAVLTLGLAGCGSGGTASSSSTTTTTTTPPTSTSTLTTGTYGLRITAAASSNAQITSSTTFTLVVQ